MICVTIHSYCPSIGSKGLRFAFGLVLRGVLEEPIRNSGVLDEAL